MKVMNVVEVEVPGELAYFVMTVKMSYAEAKKVFECYLTDIRWGDVSGDSNGEVKSI